MENEMMIYESEPLTANDIKAQVELIQDVMKKVMHDKEHFGVIPGCGDKPALLKPGAEKLNLTFRMAPDPESDIIDLDGGHREYRVKCVLRAIKSGRILGAGVGSASTMETKWRFRTGPIESTGNPVPKEYWDLRKSEPEKALALIGGKGYQTAKNPDTGQWEIVIRGERVEHDNPADYYNCVTPDTKVLTRDLQWVPAGEIESGDMIVGVNEDLTDQYARNLSIGEATVNGIRIDELYEVIFEDGRVVRCNGEHKWLVKKIGLKGTEWVSTQDIHQEIIERKGRPRNWSVMSVCTPWVEDTSKGAGYIAGLLDADGSLGSTQLYVLFTQQPNIVLSLIQHGLIDRGYNIGINPCKTQEAVDQSLSQKQVYQMRVLGGLTEQLRLLGSIRPPRLLERWLTFWDLSKRRLEGRGSGAGRPMRIITITPIGKGEIVLLGTSCHTYLAEGLVCHNTCWKMAKKRALVDAVLTVTAASDIFTQDVEEMVENGVTLQGGGTQKPPISTPKEKKPESTTPEAAANQSITVAVNSVEVKTGKHKDTVDIKTGKIIKEGKGWTLYILHTAEDKFNTFSETFANTAKQSLADKVNVTISYSETDKGKKVESILMQQAPEPGSEEQ